MLSSKKKSTEEIAEESKAFGDGQFLSKEKQSFDSLFLKLDNSGKWGQNNTAQPRAKNCLICPQFKQKKERHQKIYKFDRKKHNTIFRKL